MRKLLGATLFIVAYLTPIYIVCGQELTMDWVLIGGVFLVSACGAFVAFSLMFE